MATFFAPAANNHFLPEHTTGRSHAAELAMWSVVGVALATLMVALGISVAHSEGRLPRATLRVQGPINPPTAVIPGSTQDASGHVHLANSPAVVPANAVTANGASPNAPSTPGQPAAGGSGPSPTPPPGNNPAPPPGPQAGGSAPGTTSTETTPPTTDSPTTTDTSPPTTDPGGLIDVPPPTDTTPPDTSPPDTTPDTTPPSTDGGDSANGGLPPEIFNPGPF